MVDAGDRSCVMEATSIAGAQGRLDRHALRRARLHEPDPGPPRLPRDDGGYFEAKRALFAQAERAVVNVGDEWGRRLAGRAPECADVHARRRPRRHRPAAARPLQPCERARRGRARPGRSGSTRTRSARASRRSRGVPGRFESIEAGQPFAVIVDYAHTPDSLDNVLEAARGLGDGRLIVVFGAGGDRDREKRPLMGRVGGGARRSRDRHLRQPALRGPGRDRRGGRARAGSRSSSTGGPRSRPRWRCPARRRGRDRGQGRRRRDGARRAARFRSTTASSRARCSS